MTRRVCGMVPPCSRKNAPKSTRVERAATFDGAAERDLIGKLEIAAVRHAAGDAADDDAPCRELACEQERGGLAIDRRRRGDDDLAHAVFADAPEQLFERELVGADAVEWREQATKHEVAAA